LLQIFSSSSYPCGKIYKKTKSVEVLGILASGPNSMVALRFVIPILLTIAWPQQVEKEKLVGKINYSKVIYVVVVFPY